MFQEKSPGFLVSWNENPKNKKASIIFPGFS